MRSRLRAEPEAAPRGGPAAAEQRRFLRDALEGLAARPRSLPSRWFYDARGSRLFQWISRLPDYYLTRAETEILGRHGGAVAALLAGRPCTVVDLGAGDGHKTHLLLARLQERVPALRYVPLDVSPAALAEAAARVRAAFPEATVRPLRAEYAEGLRRLPAGPGGRLVLFLGSNVGNLEPDAAARFLRGLRLALRPGDHALVGFDLVKPLDRLRRAYDDPQGVTRAFNLNLLARMNRELGADFALSGFRHRATWDRRRPAMESWLESVRRQEVHLAGRTFRFEPGERIHTEISRKFTPAAIGALARAAGFRPVATFRDGRGWFADALWRVG